MLRLLYFAFEYRALPWPCACGVPGIIRAMIALETARPAPALRDFVCIYAQRQEIGMLARWRYPVSSSRNNLHDVTVQVLTGLLNFKTDSAKKAP
jgi:hypothetical protein